MNGAPQELTDASGEIVWRMQYRVWGNTVVETAVEEYRPRQNLRFQGQYLDRETGLHYSAFRYYDPDVGRFITPDPIGLAGRINVYQYAPNPISWIDPWGWTPTPLNAPNYSTYGLFHPGETTPYYVGHTGQTLDGRLADHMRTGRATGSTENQALGGKEGSLTYSQSKGYEQAYREKYQTKTGFPENVIEPIDKARTDIRGKSNNKYYKKMAKKLGLGKCWGK